MLTKSPALVLGDAGERAGGNYAAPQFLPCHVRRVTLTPPGINTTFPLIPHWLLRIKMRAPKAIRQMSGVAANWNRINIWWCMACWEEQETPAVAAVTPAVTPGCFVLTQPWCVPRAASRARTALPACGMCLRVWEGTLQQNRAAGSQPQPATASFVLFALLPVQLGCPHWDLEYLYELWSRYSSPFCCSSEHSSEQGKWGL